MDEFARSIRRPFFYDMIMDNDDIYFSMVQYNALCRASLTNDRIEIINTIPDIPIYKQRGYVGVFKIKQWLLISSAEREDYLFIYDISSGRFFRIINNRKISFYSFQVFDYNDNFYIVSADTAEIIKIESENLIMKTFDNHENILKEAAIGIPIRLGNRIHIPINKKKILLVFDLEKEKYEAFAFPCNISYISTMSYHDDCFFITGLDKKIYAWNIYDKKAAEIANVPNNVKSYYSGYVCFTHSLIYNDILFLFPGFADATLKVNVITGKVETLEISGEEESAEEIDRELRNGRCFPVKYNIVQRQNEKVFFRSSKTRLLYEMDLRTSEIIKHDFKVRNIYQNKLYPPAINGILSENYYMDGLSALIENLEEKVMNINVSQRQRVGEIIYKAVKR